MPTGLHVLHPFTGQPLAVWVANYVLMAYGEGAVMGVPAHDERDFEFAHREPPAGRHGGEIAQAARTRACEQPWVPAYAEYGITVNSGEFSGLGFQAAVDAIAAALEQQGPRQEARAVPAARLGHLAPALLGLPDPDHSLRRLRRGAGAR